MKKVKLSRVIENMIKEKLINVDENMPFILLNYDLYHILKDIENELEIEYDTLALTVINKKPQFVIRNPLYKEKPKAKTKIDISKLIK
ncbi:MAG: hypothetical protein QXW35_03545 [Candidatus Aenigmatarchaeota archaeon]